jgi:hypothetical protein
MSSFCKRKPNKWKRYNAWRSQNRAVDRSRRLARFAEKKAAYLAGYVVPKCAVPRAPKAWARVRISFADGSSAGFSIRQGPHGLTISPTLAGRKLVTLLINQSPSPSRQSCPSQVRS